MPSFSYPPLYTPLPTASLSSGACVGKFPPWGKLLLLAMPCGMWDLSFLARIRTPALEAWSLNHWTARKVPEEGFKPEDDFI